MTLDLAAFTAQARAAHAASKGRPEVWQNPNGTYSHRFDGRREWSDRADCAFDLRLCKEWGCK